MSGLIAFDGGRVRQQNGRLRKARAGEPLFRAGDPAHCIYAVRQGMLKTVHVNADGDEQILALNTPGEVLGLEAFSTGTYHKRRDRAASTSSAASCRCVNSTNTARASGNSVRRSSGC